MSSAMMMEKEEDSKYQKSKIGSTPANAAATATVSVRIQPPRASKVQLPALVTGKEPELTGKSEEAFQRERVKKFGYVHGLRANALITAWQAGSKTIRQFFLDGVMGEFFYRPYLQWDENYTQLTLPKWDENFTQLTLPAFRTNKDNYDQLLDLDAFWNVMTKGPLDRFPRDTVLYRGVRRYPGEQLPNVGYVVQNVLTNWSSSPKVADGFASDDTGALYMATFPKDTKYLYTGEALAEFEYIIPGGTFQLSNYPKLVKSSTGNVTLLQFRYIPGPRGQFFPWPSKSPSPSTRAAYQKSLETMVLPDMITYHLTIDKDTTLAKMIQEFETLKKRTGYVGTKTIFDYPTAFLGRLQQPKKENVSNETIQKLQNEYAVMYNAYTDLRKPSTAASP